MIFIRRKLQSKVFEMPHGPPDCPGNLIQTAPPETFKNTKVNGFVQAQQFSVAQQPPHHSCNVKVISWASLLRKKRGEKGKKK